MPIDPAKARRLNNALVSVYHYSRQGTVGPPTSIRIVPLDRAVDDLLVDLSDTEALKSRILALLDLCRTRVAPPAPLVDAQIVHAQIIRLARAIGPQIGLPADGFASQVTSIFQPPVPTPDEAYVKAANLLGTLRSSSVFLVSYERVP